MLAPYFPDWRGVYRSEHLPGIFCAPWNKLSGYIPAYWHSRKIPAKYHNLRLPR